ncbi:MAG: hypothetical protein KKB30_02905 [Proteobacteria bacterium]|nr:hypothetical protein [Pseudomonadota bacterium]MBU1716708.1 hypothetical protein [Pseudomonadota bacterium]
MNYKLRPADLRNTSCSKVKTRKGVPFGHIWSNMFKGIIFLQILLSVMVEGSFAADLSKVNLADGSIISGELISIDDGIYTVKPQSLGTIKVKSSDIKSIDNQTKTSNSSRKADQSAPTAEIKAIQQQLMGNEEIMNLIFSLRNDPNIQKAMQNPEFMKAINSWDLNTLQNDPLFNEILKNSTIQLIKNKGIKQ